MSKRFEDIMNVVGKIVPVVSIVVAVIALWVSHQAFQKQLDQSKQQLDQSMTVAKAQVKPYLTFYASNIGGEDEFVLKNAGPGTAVIKKVTLFKNGEETHELNLGRLFNAKSSKEYASTLYTFAPPQPIMSGAQVVLIELSEGELKHQGFSAKQIAEIVKTFQEEARKISIEIEYEDVLRNPQDKLKSTLEINP